MILLDLNPIVIANVAMHGKSAVEISEDLIRHMIFNSVRAVLNKYKREYGELIICCDNYRTQNWRKKVFPHYKANRKAGRAASKIDFKLVHTMIDKIKNEIRENDLYRIIEIDGAEADDIIGHLASNATEPTLIVSGDKDFLQLQSNKYVRQYSPIFDKMITTDDPIMFLHDHILRGDRGDGVPNYLSPDDCFVSKSRQKVLTKKKLAQTSMNEEETRNYKRNQMLIDLAMTPNSIREEIDSYMAEPKRTIKKQDLLNYFIKNGLNALIRDLDQF